MFATPLPPSGIQSIRTLGDGATSYPTSSAAAAYSTVPTPSAASTVTSVTANTISTSSDAMPYGVGWSWTTWGLIIVGLSVLGLNVFAYLAKGADAGAWIIRTFITPIFSIFGLETINTAKQILKTSDEGASATSAAGISVLDALETGIGGDSAAASGTGGAGAGAGAAGAGAAGAAGAGAANVFLDIAPRSSVQQDPSPTSAFASGSGGSTGDSGWCLIGEDSTAGGARTCANVGAADRCMSGDVFPTQEVCVNPSLRA